MPEVKRIPLLDSVTLERQAQQYGLASNALERLVAMDRALRFLVASSAAGGLPPDEIFGYALAGPVALICVYLHTGIPLRLPDELTFVPVRRDVAYSSSDLARSVAAALPSGTMAPDSRDTEAFHIDFLGLKGPGNFLLRVERPVLAMAAPLDVHLAAAAHPGYLYDPRMKFSPNFSTPFPVPVAYAEEIILRTMRALIMFAKRDTPPARIDDRPCRADDLRLLLRYEYEATLYAVGFPVRARLMELLGTSVPFDPWIRNFVLALEDQVRRTCQTDAVPPTLRPSGAGYDEDERLDFLHKISVLADVLQHGG
jgi:hypothetical protein